MLNDELDRYRKMGNMPTRDMVSLSRGEIKMLVENIDELKDEVEKLEEQLEYACQTQRGDC